MNHVTILWSVVGASALLLAIVHSIIWFLDRRARASRAFAFMCLAAVGIVWTELGMMNAATPQEWGEWVRWFQPANFGITVGAVLFVRLSMKTGRGWLLWTVIALRTFILV